MVEKNDKPIRTMRRVDRLSGMVLFFSAAMLIGLAGRVLWLQTHVTRADIGSLKSQHDVRVTLMARRASIYTSDSTLIAGSVRVYSMFADPGYIFDPKGNLNALAGAQLIASRKIMAAAMAGLLNENQEDFMAWLKSRLYYANGGLRRFVWLKRGANHAFYHQFEMVKRGLIHQSRLAQGIIIRYWRRNIFTHWMAWALFSPHAASIRWGILPGRSSALPILKLALMGWNLN